MSQGHRWNHKRVYRNLHANIELEPQDQTTQAVEADKPMP